MPLRGKGGSEVTGPVLSLPRPILELALTRDVEADAAQVSKVVGGLAQIGELAAAWYGSFLQDVAENVEVRRSAKAYTNWT